MTRRAGAATDRAAFRAFVRAHHPDVGGDPETFRAGLAAFGGRAALPLADDELTGAQDRCGGVDNVVEVPVYVSPIAVIYNLPGVEKLQLSPATVAKIFAQKIKNWNDPAIAADNPDADRRNAVTVFNGPVDFADPTSWTGSIDRCPCGTGTCAAMAVLHAKGTLGLREPFRHEGILGTVYQGELIEEVPVGPYAGVIPTISGRAWITGYSTHVLDPTDPFAEGYTVGDLWA